MGGTLVNLVVKENEEGGWEEIGLAVQVEGTSKIFYFWFDPEEWGGEKLLVSILRLFDLIGTRFLGKLRMAWAITVFQFECIRAGLDAKAADEYQNKMMQVVCEYMEIVLAVPMPEQTEYYLHP